MCISFSLNVGCSRICALLRSMTVDCYVSVLICSCLYHGVPFFDAASSTSNGCGFSSSAALSNASSPKGSIEGRLM